MSGDRRQHRATVVGVLIGVGMSGFVDGIVLHQIAQWHHMLSNIVPPHTMEYKRVNMTWDGLFHALTWIVTLIGILLLRSAAFARVGQPHAHPTPPRCGHSPQGLPALAAPGPGVAG
jgi:uncharacterized membrane protein